MLINIEEDFQKKDNKIINEFIDNLNKINKYNKQQTKNILKSLSNLHLYSFCKVMR